MPLDVYELRRGLHFLSSAGVLMERIGRANVSNQPSIQLTLANLTIPRFAKKSLSNAGKVQSIAWILSEGLRPFLVNLDHWGAQVQAQARLLSRSSSR